MKTLYYEIEQAIRNHATLMSVANETTQDDVYQCIRKIMRENPDIFWFSHQWQYTEDDHTIRFHYTIDEKKSEKAKKQIEDVVQNDFQIVKVSSLSVTEQIMYVYKWLALYCKYNIYSAYNQTIFSVFVCRNSVCTGYAKAAQYLFKLLGIESKLVFGTMRNAERGSRHCWLVIRVNDLWYHFDPTFAIPDIKNLLLDSEVEPIYGSDGLVYNFYCCDTETIKQSRTIEDENELPICTSNIDYKSTQDIPVQSYRNNNYESQGVRGCLLSGRGNYADVYLWHSKDDNQKVVKVYKNDENHDLLRHESQIMRKLTQVSSVIHLCGITDNQDGIIIDQATPLSDLLCSHYYQLSAVAFCKLLLDVLEGLRDCKNRGIYYRDIHLNNIYRTKSGRYVLGDFGSCAYIEENTPSAIGGVGSPWYSAPETYLNGEFKETSATYDLGMLAYFLLNEFFPPLWNKFGKNSLTYRIKGCELPSPALLRKPRCAFEQQMASVIKKSLSFESQNRYQNLDDLENAIRQCMSLVEGDDYLLIGGGTSERPVQLDSEFNTKKDKSHDNTDFQSTCVLSPEILVSNGETESIALVDEDDNQHDILPYENNRELSWDDEIVELGNPNIDDFASTAVGPITHSDNTPQTYQPRYEHECSVQKSSSKSIWSTIFQKRKKKSIEDIVYGSIYAPAEVKRSSPMLIQVYLHLLEETKMVQSLAKEADKNAERRDYLPLQCKLKKGDKVDVSLFIYGEALLMSDKKSIVWQGSFTKCSFDYFVPNDINVDELSCMVLLSIDEIPIGEMRFISMIIEKPRQLNPEIIAKQYQKIFISYAHQDEAQVEPMARAYKAQGVEYFFDRHYLNPGDIFPLKIQEFIDSADLFILCWSANAANSNYVELERKRALERAFPKIKPFEKAPLRIYPMMIEPQADIPADMRDTYNFEFVNINK